MRWRPSHRNVKVQFILLRNLMAGWLIMVTMKWPNANCLRLPVQPLGGGVGDSMEEETPDSREFAINTQSEQDPLSGTSFPLFSEVNRENSRVTNPAPKLALHGISTHHLPTGEVVTIANIQMWRKIKRFATSFSEDPYDSLSDVVEHTPKQSNVDELFNKPSGTHDADDGILNVDRHNIGEGTHNTRADFINRHLLLLQLNESQGTQLSVRDITDMLNQGKEQSSNSSHAATTPWTTRILVNPPLEYSDNQRGVLTNRNTTSAHTVPSLVTRINSYTTTVTTVTSVSKDNSSSGDGVDLRTNPFFTSPFIIREPVNRFFPTTDQTIVNPVISQSDFPLHPLSSGSPTIASRAPSTQMAVSDTSTIFPNNNLQTENVNKTENNSSPTQPSSMYYSTPVGITQGTSTVSHGVKPADVSSMLIPVTTATVYPHAVTNHSTYQKPNVSVTTVGYSSSLSSNSPYNQSWLVTSEYLTSTRHFKPTLETAHASSSPDGSSENSVTISSVVGFTSTVKTSTYSSNSDLFFGGSDQPAMNSIDPSNDPEVQSQVKGASDDLLGVGAIVGIILGVISIVVLVAAIFGYLIYHRRARLPIKGHKYQTDNCAYVDDSLRVSYINNHIELPKESSEEMFSLDNDSFLNSLEAMTLQNYWAEDAKNTKV